MGDELSALGEELLAAYASRQPIAPLTDRYPDLTLSQAYAIQEHQVKAWRQAGRTIVGYKVGLTSRAMQEQLGVDQPDFGRLLDDMVLDPSTPIALGRFISPKVEPEIAFVLKEELTGPGLGAGDVARAIDYAVISLEIIDSRVADWRIKLADTIADNASSGALALGEAHVDVSEVDLADARVELRLNDESIAAGTGSAVLGHPVNGLLWVANTLGSLGQSLEAGSIVMAGSMTKAISIQPGDRVTADFGALGSIDVRFV